MYLPRSVPVTQFKNAKMPVVRFIITLFFNKVYINEVYNIKTIKRLHKTSASLQSLNRFKTSNTIITRF